MSEAKLQTVLMLVTPGMAKDWLGKNLSNRNISPKHVDKLKKTIENDEWQVTHQGIAIYEDGTLADGQHRLTAIVLANKAVQMYVTFNVTVEAGMAIDQQSRSRTLADSMKMSGRLEAKSVVAICRHWMMLLGTYHAADFEIRKFEEEHIKYIEQALIMAKGHNTLKHSAVASVIAMGIRAGHELMLQDWCEVVRTGVTLGPKQSAAVRFRDYWSSGPKNGNTTARRDHSRRAYASMKAFVEGRPLAKLYAVEVIDWL